jgi:hypothetical protein
MGWSVSALRCFWRQYLNKSKGKKMAESVIIPAGGKVKILTPQRYLKVLNHSGTFEVSVSGQPALDGAAESYELGVLANDAFLVNTSNDTITVRYETSDVPTRGRTSIADTIVVERINQPINVNAKATVEDGKMRRIVANAMISHDDITIAPGQSQLVVAAREATDREVILQLVGTDYTSVRIGADNATSATKGILLAGDINAIATLKQMTTTPLYARNTGANDAVVAVTEVFRQ